MKKEQIISIATVISDTAVFNNLPHENVIGFCLLSDTENFCFQVGKNISQDENLTSCVEDIYDYAGFKLQGKPKAIFFVF